MQESQRFLLLFFGSGGWGEEVATDHSAIRAEDCNSINLIYLPLVGLGGQGLFCAVAPGLYRRTSSGKRAVLVGSNILLRARIRYLRFVIKGILQGARNRWGYLY